MFDSLRSVSDQKILSDTDAIVVQDRKLTLRLLHHLQEIERRKLYLKRGHGSMFQYCTTRLRFSEPAAARRIRTARCLARFAQLHGLLESGDVSLTTVSMVAKLLKPENVDAILSRIRGKSRRDVERVVAEYEPRATLPPDRIRLVVVPVSATSASRVSTVASDSEKSPSVETSESNDSIAGDDQRSPAPTVVQQVARRALVQFTAHEELMAKLDRIRSLASHRLPANATLEQLLDFMADVVLEREDPEARQARRDARVAKRGAMAKRWMVGKSAVSDNPRQIPTRVRDEVFVRDKRCTYVSPGGKRCNSTHVLQVDHIHPVARGGASTIDNLRLLCAHHNRLESERLMGRSGPPS